MQPLQNKWEGQCVRFVNKLLGMEIKGNAWDWKPETQYPVVGGAVLFQKHVAVVVGIIGDHIVLAESNYSWDERVDIGRTVKIGDASIRGYIPPKGTMAYNPAHGSQTQ